MDQHGLARLQRAAFEHIVPDREECLRNRAGFHHAERRDDRQRVALVHRHVFGVAAAGDERRDLVAGLPALHAVAERHDLAGDLEAWNIGRARGRGILSLALHHIGAVHACGRDPDQHLARLRRRHVALLWHQHVRLAGLADRDCGHAGRDAHRACPRFVSRLNSACPAKVDTGFAKKDMRKPRTPCGSGCDNHLERS
jgi:hypothetical protein